MNLKQFSCLHWSMHSSTDGEWIACLLDERDLQSLAWSHDKTFFGELMHVFVDRRNSQYFARPAVVTRAFDPIDLLVQSCIRDSLLADIQRAHDEDLLWKGLGLIP